MGWPFAAPQNAWPAISGSSPAKARSEAGVGSPVSNSISPSTIEQWVVQQFSGVLCVDEVYQGDLALLVAVDPAAPDGDRLIGYLLISATVKQADIERLLTRLRAAPIQPDQVITDGSLLYPRRGALNIRSASPPDVSSAIAVARPSSATPVR